mgnify:CR=1 FL=1|tara:strand:- start:301 stop:567 length:267 start_codon:yes stop_codon:yes gene_type:complete
MPKFRKKPVVIDAWLWDETKTTFSKIGCKSMSFGSHTSYPDLMNNLRIETLEGTMSADKGDYIIKGIKGEFYPCKPDIFNLTYDAIEE